MIYSQIYQIYVINLNDSGILGGILLLFTTIWGDQPTSFWIGPYSHLMGFTRWPQKPTYRGYLKKPSYPRFFAGHWKQGYIWGL